jgi:hypothetical protein
MHSGVSFSGELTSGETSRASISSAGHGRSTASSLLVGYGMASSKGRNWLHMLGLVFVMAVSV